MATAFVKIGSVVVGSGGAANIEFTSIPQTYKDLFIVCNLRTTNAGNFGVPLLRFNGATTDANMNNRMLLAEGSSASNSTTSQGFVIRRCPGGNNTANMFGTTTIWLTDYASTTNHKFFEGFATCPSDSSSTSAIGISGCVWSDASAISSIKILEDNGASFAQYSSAFLYGIKNS